MMKKMMVVIVLSVLVSACSGNYKTSDDRYRTIGEPPVTINQNNK